MSKKDEHGREPVKALELREAWMGFVRGSMPCRGVAISAADGLAINNVMQASDADRVQTNGWSKTESIVAYVECLCPFAQVQQD